MPLKCCHRPINIGIILEKLTANIIFFICAFVLMISKKSKYKKNKLEILKNDLKAYTLYSEKKNEASQIIKKIKNGVFAGVRLKSTLFARIKKIPHKTTKYIKTQCRLNASASADSNIKIPSVSGRKKMNKSSPHSKFFKKADKKSRQPANKIKYCGPIA